MKIYYYLVIAFGVMLTLFLAGAETTSSNFINLFVDSTTHTIKAPDFNTETNNTLIGAMLVFLGALALVSGVNRIQIGQFSLGGEPREALIAVLASSIWIVTVMDMWSIVQLVSSPAWLQWIMVAMIGSYIVGFAVSIISFTGGSD